MWKFYSNQIRGFMLNILLSLFYDKYKLYKSPHVIFEDFKILVDNIKKILNNKTIFSDKFQNLKTLLEHEYFFLKDLYYDDVIRFCTKFIDYIDIIIRSNNIDNPPEEYFQRKRYYYYMEYCISKFPNIILFPTFDNIGATDLIKVRCIPVFFIGITTDLIYADEFLLSPSEFYFHDINHARIMYQQNEEYIKKNNITNDKLIENMSTTTHKYYEDIKKIKDNGMKNVMKMLIFEIIHEDGFPMIDTILCEKLVRKQGIDFVERMTNKGIEKVDKKTSSTLGFSLVKLRCHFFEENTPIEQIVPKNYRTLDKIIEAAQKLLDIFGCPTIEYETLKKIITNNTTLRQKKSCLDNIMIAGANIRLRKKSLIYKKSLNKSIKKSIKRTNKNKK